MNTENQSENNHSSCCHHHKTNDLGDIQKYDTVPANHQGMIYICPMCAPVRSPEPGSCPICGMALEAESPNFEGEEAPNHELIDFKKRLSIALIFTIPLFILAMSSHIGLSQLRLALGEKTALWLELLFATPVVFYSGYPFLQRGINSFKAMNLNMFSLIALGVGAAYLFSVIAVGLPHLFPIGFQDENGLVAVYFEAAAVIIALVLIGQILEQKARAQSGAAIKALLGLRAKTAIKITNGVDEEIALKDIQIGDYLRVNQGAKIPIDGVITDGEATIDESMITGEAMPVYKSVNDAVVGATINQSGSLIIKATANIENSILSQIIDFVAKAQRSRAPIQKYVDKIASYFVPAIIFVAILSFVIWSLFGPEPSLAYGLIAAISVLIIACPCALGLATPISIMVSMGRGAELGILIKTSEVLEKFEKIDSLILDKTGTLTKGNLTLKTIYSANHQDEDLLLKLMASLEQASSHPLSKPIIEAAKQKQLQLSSPINVEEIAGRGMSGIVENKKIHLGNAEFMEENHIAINSLEDTANQHRNQGEIALFMAIEGELSSLVILFDEIKENTKQIIDELKNHGIKIIMATGDHEKTAKAIAHQLSIQDYYANTTPLEKADLIEKLQAKGHKVAMAGDGINDAPALAKADCGIAMGTGADIAIETADITLIKGDLQGLLRARLLVKATMANIRQNLFFAFFYNAIGVAIAAGLLFPLFGLLLSPMVAAAAMSASSLCVISNALRLKLFKP